MHSPESLIRALWDAAADVLVPSRSAPAEPEHRGVDLLLRLEIRHGEPTETDDGGFKYFGVLALRGLEAGAALAVIAVGLLLLTGYMASERMFGV